MKGTHHPKEQCEQESLVAAAPYVSSNRIIYTPSAFARSSLLHLQETGRLTALYPHKNERNGLASCLFFIVLSGKGILYYDGVHYALQPGDCVFINCKKAYSHETGEKSSAGESQQLWSLLWCHFYGPNMNAIYRKYLERGGRPVFNPDKEIGPGRLERYKSVLHELYQIAGSADYVRDMRIQEKLSALLILLMEDAWSEERQTGEVHTTVEIQKVKEYLDQNFTRKITLDELAADFFINKYYLLTLFKERYGTTITAYLNQIRITYVKQQLRFTDKTVEALADELNMESAYLSRLFKKIEGISPSEYRKQWNGRGRMEF